MNTYETTFIVAPAAPPENLEAIAEKVKKIITKKGGDIAVFEMEGLKKLAYPIEGYKEGFYHFVEFSAPGDVISELENFYRITDQLIRYLTITKPLPRKVKPKKKKKITNVPPSGDGSVG